ncbi:MAG TPA: STAS domain-containing protein [Actinomycetota bacterium]|nr:STAS domain-containing protein [Actinomycetota bacterium]
MVAPEGSAPGPLRAQPPTPEPNAMFVEIAGRIDRAEIPVLCERVRDALEASLADLVVCDVGALTDPDCVAVDALARLQLTVGRLGCRLRLRGVTPELRALLCFVGLSEVVGQDATSGVEPRRQPE